MKSFAIALELALSFSSVGVLAQSQGDESPAQVRADESSASVDTAVGEESGEGKPSGELVRMLGLPEAELMIDVHLVSNDARARFEISSEKTDASLLTCGQPCRFRIWPGRYRLATNASAGYVGGTNPFVVERDATLRLTQPPSHRPSLGVFVMTVGLAGAVVGGALLASNYCGADCSAASAKRSQVGFASLGIGLVLTSAGLILFAQNQNPDLVIEQTPSKRRE